MIDLHEGILLEFTARKGEEHYASVGLTLRRPNVRVRVRPRGKCQRCGGDASAVFCDPCGAFTKDAKQARKLALREAHARTCGQ